MNLEEAILNFPQFALGVFLGLLKAALTEIEVFLVVVFGILLGLLTGSVLAGLTGALGVYLAFRMTSQVAALFAKKLDILAAIMRERG